MSRYIVRCPNGNHLGCSYWDKKSYSIFRMVELNCMMYLININLKLIKLYLNIQIKLNWVIF